MRLRPISSTSALLLTILQLQATETRSGNLLSLPRTAIVIAETNPQCRFSQRFLTLTSRLSLAKPALPLGTTFGQLQIQYNIQPLNSSPRFCLCLLTTSIHRKCLHQTSHAPLLGSWAGTTSLSTAESLLSIAPQETLIRSSLRHQPAPLAQTRRIL